MLTNMFATMSKNREPQHSGATEVGVRKRVHKHVHKNVRTPVRTHVRKRYDNAMMVYIYIF